MRGSLAVIPAIAGTLGLLTTQVLGAVLNWQWLSIVCASLNVPFLLMLIFIPESPVYLISTEQIERAHKILRVLRGTIPRFTEKCQFYRCEQPNWEFLTVDIPKCGKAIFLSF